MTLQRISHIDTALGAALISGGDDRLRINCSTGMNQYGCVPHPRSAEISFSSTTASTISASAYEAAAAAFAELRPDAAGAASRYEYAMDSLRNSLKHSFGWSDESVILSPSGTDCELLVLQLLKTVLKRPLSSIIVSADESGSGVDLAASGHHFSSSTSSGRTVRKGTPVDALTSSIIKIAARDRAGNLVPPEAIDRTVMENAATEIKSGRDVILHVMHHSKTGARGPSEKCLTLLRTELSPNLQIVVDACQARASREELKQLLASGYILLVTGSKFFCGPPLSGAIIVPSGLAEEVRRTSAKGLEHYSTRCDWPRGWRMREELSDRINVGQLLRWTAALVEIDRYFAVPLPFRERALQIFEAVARKAFAQHGGDVALLDSAADAPNSGNMLAAEFRSRTVFPFTVATSDGIVSEPDARLLHQALNIDVSHLGSAQVASLYCHIGQPVRVKRGAGAAGALRISADARLISESWFGGSQDGAIERLFERCRQVETVLKKISFLASNIEGVRQTLRERLEAVGS